MKPKAYIETSVISYYTARPSRDLVVAAHQEITHDWWDNHRLNYDLYTSQAVHDEASAGDPQAAAKRIQALQGIDWLDVSNDAAELSEKLLAQKCLPKKTMWTDPIIEEIHKIRQEHAAKFNYDLRAIVRDYQRRQKLSGKKIVSFTQGIKYREVPNDKVARQGSYESLT